ncbi:MAG: D-alanyl-D-alanine carboxypeptidase [Erysipelotrichales bacterium]|nr:D-alanyl-D-alanine carboxypeptidase [Erysipelotrichales bacterium]
MKVLSKIFILILSIFPINIFAIELPNLYSNNVLLYDVENEEILYDKNIDEIINIASLTKIFTTIVAIENINDLNEYVTINDAMLREVPYDASIAGLKSGDNVTYLDLLYASILPSGADATIALAHGISNSTENFVKLMNEKATSLGLENTHFENVTGYDGVNHHSTTREVLKFLLYALENPLFKKIYTTRDYELANGLKVSATINYYNKYGLYDTTPIIGSKTGFTSKAGQCMSSIINVVDKELILLTFGAQRTDNKSAHNLDDAFTIIDYLNSNFKNRVIFKKGDTLLTIPVEYSNIDEYEIKVQEDVIEYTDEIKAEERKIEYKGINSLDYNYKKGDKLGTVTYYFKDKVYTEDIYLKEDISIDIIKYLYFHQIYVTPVIGIIILVLLIRRKHKKEIEKHVIIS